MKHHAPPWFINEMKIFDPELRVRWSEKANIFMLERKIANSKPVDTKKDSFSDEYIRAREGYVLVALIPHDKFSREIFNILRINDLWSNGGWEHMARTIEELEAEEEQKRWQRFSDDIVSHSKEIFEWMQYRDGERIFVPRAIQ